MSGAYKGDISRGERISRVSSEWFSPPDDERYLSLGALHEAVRERAERATARIVETKALRLEATRGIDGDGADLVISRDYISRGLRGRAEELVGLELGPRSEQAIRTSLEREAAAECWTSLDRAVRAIADENAGVADLRLAGGDDPELRRVMVGRAQTLEHLGLAEPIGPAQWTLKLDAEPTLRVLGERGDIIKTMHRALSRSDRAPDLGAFAIHGDGQPNGPGRLADRGLHDELNGSAYVVIDGLGGRPHHVRFASPEATGDAQGGCDRRSAAVHG